MSSKEYPIEVVLLEEGLPLYIELFSLLACQCEEMIVIDLHNPVFIQR